MSSRYRTFSIGQIVEVPNGYAEIVGQSYGIVYLRYANGFYDTETVDRVGAADHRAHRLFLANRDMLRILADVGGYESAAAMNAVVERMLAAPTVDVGDDR